MLIILLDTIFFTIKSAFDDINVRLSEENIHHLKIFEGQKPTRLLLRNISI